MPAPAIRTIEDLMQVLDAHPQWLEAMRARLLTRELLELPQTVANLAKTTNERFDGVDKRLDGVDKRFDSVDKRFDGVDKRFDGVDKRFDGVDKRFDKAEADIQETRNDLADFAKTTNERFDGVDKRFDKVETDIRGLRNDIRRIRNDMAPLKGAHARNGALREADMIAESMGLSLTRILPDSEIRDLVQSCDTTGIAKNELISFRLADLILEAEDQKGERCYIAAEISYTANGRDTTRAIRNAGFLTRFTGSPAHAAIVAQHTDDRIQESIDRGKVSWYRLNAKYLEVD